MSPWPRRHSLHFSLTLTGWQLSSAGSEVANGQWQLASVEALQHALEAMTIDEATAGAQVDVTLADELVRGFVVSPPGDAKSLQELEQCAQIRFEMLFGGEGDWLLRGIWHPTRPFLVLAVPVDLISAIERLCVKQKWQLKSCQVMWARLLSACRRQSTIQWWAFVSERMLTVLRTEGDSIQHILAIRRAADCQHPTAEVIVERERLRWGQDATQASPASVEWLDEANYSSPQGTGFDSLDLGGMRRIWKLPKWPRLLPTFAAALLTVIGFGLAMHGWIGVSQEHASQSERLKLLPQPEAGDLDKKVILSPSQIDAINEAVGSLNVPWPSIFHALEVATPNDVSLLALEPDNHQAKVRGSALARDEHAMFSYVGRLAEVPPFVAAHLLRQEAVGQEGKGGVRFQFDVTLNLPKVQGAGTP